MYPVIELGPIAIRTYLLMWTMGALIFMSGLYHRSAAWERPLNNPEVIDIGFYVLFGAIPGSWLATNLPDFAAFLTGEPVGPRLGRGCASWFGILASGALAGYIYCRRRKLPVGRYFDLAAPIVPLAHAIGRGGCLLAGCCYGWRTTDWPSMMLPDDHGVWASRYPTQIVSISALILIAGAILVFERYRMSRWGKTSRWPFPGFLFMGYVLLFCVERFYFEFWRADTRTLVGPLTWNHLYCAIGITVAVTLMVRGFRRARSSTPVAEVGSGAA